MVARLAAAAAAAADLAVASPFLRRITAPCGRCRAEPTASALGRRARPLPRAPSEAGVGGDGRPPPLSE
jgi:hypothetical protein